ncbi:hypothetical protein [Flavonifractor sp. An100]|uniref:hypothetical protein n=1 Tax=Flavonifractor sp. An100 TaxID=1965538 RepID=UPI0019D29E8F|nr:hypothetical protein [Flavonifractor sp. An100]
MDEKIFEVEISNTGPKGYETAWVLRLPCTQAEYRDALQKARIEDGRLCHNELTQINDPGITSAMIGQDVDLLELNLLALRLTMLSDEDRMGLDGLLRMEQERHTGPIPLSQLINLTFNADICLLAPQVTDTQELGALLFEGEMLTDEAMALLDTTEPDSKYRERLLAVFGEQHMESHGGVFTARGYVEPGGDFKEVYRKGEMFPFLLAGGAVTLEISYNGGQPMTLKLPALEADIQKALGAVGTASPEECAFRCVDCEIPALREAVDASIHEEGGIGQANEFARLIAQKKRVWRAADFIKYKALLAVSGSPRLQDAIQLAYGLDQYELNQDVAQTWEYAKLVLREKYPDLPEELFQTPQAAQIGRQLLDEDNAVITDYGLLWRKDGCQLPVFGQEAEQSEQPQMGGMEMM